MQQSCFFDRKRRKVRNMTAGSVILLHEESKNEWKDDAGHDSGAHCPGDAEYVKLRKLAPRKRKKAEMKKPLDVKAWHPGCGRRLLAMKMHSNVLNLNLYM